MKKIIPLLFIMCVLHINLTKAQCTGCVISAPSTNNTDIFSDSHVTLNNQVVLDTTLQLHLSPTTLLPYLSGNIQQILSTTFSTANNLPPGMQYLPNQNSYDIPAGDTLGCIRFCSANTPPGTYTAHFYFNVVYSTLPGGNPNTETQLIEVPIVFTITGRYSLPYLSFNFDGINMQRNYRMCGQKPIANTALLRGCQKQYQWNLDGDDVSRTLGLTIMPYPFSPGYHFLALTTTVYKMQVKRIVASAIGNWDGGTTADSLADMYVTATGNSSEATHGNNQVNVQFTNLNWIVPENECNGYEVEIMDYDSGGVAQLIDVYSITPAAGMFTWQRPNSQITVTFDTIVDYIQRDTMWFLADTFHHEAEMYFADDTVCQGDSILLTPVEYNPDFTYQWHCNCIDSNYATGPSYYAVATGYYRLKVIDSTCHKFSATQRLFFAQRPNENTVIMRTGDSLQLSPGQYSPFKIDWYRNDTLYISGPNKIYAPLPDTYSAIVYNNQNPECSFEPGFLPTGIAKPDNMGAISVYPNPSNGYFKVNTMDATGTLHLLNALGEQVHSQNITSNTTIVNTDVPPGIYLLQSYTSTGVNTTRVIVVEY